MQCHSAFERNIFVKQNAPEVLSRTLRFGSDRHLKLLKGETDGYFLGGYRLLYKIASGSFGRVFRADDPSSGTVVAIKVLRRRWSEMPVVDDRTPEEILGYDEHGLPR